VTTRRTGRLAWSCWLLCAALSGLSVVFLTLSVATPIPPHFGFRGEDAVLALTVSTVGAVVAVRRPHNPVGWLFCAAGLGVAVTEFAFEYAIYAVLTRAGSLPLGPQVAWITEWLWWPALGAVVCVFLLFPDGRLLSPGWRPLAWLTGIAPVVTAITAALSPGPLTEFAAVANPFGVEQAGSVRDLAGAAGVLGFVLALGGAGLSLVVRYRRARGVQRQQLKWIAYAAALVAIAQVTSFAGFLLRGTSPMVLAVLVTCAWAAIPVAAGIAILRYRLYDVDRLINRTLVYGLLTALLGAVYAGLVLGLGQLFGRLGDQPPGWAVAGATLAVVVLVRPLRDRIQGGVDRRFNRRKYDAAKTIEAFSARLREELDLDALSAELLGVVDQTMQPTTASLWLRPPTRAPQDQGASAARRPAAGPTTPRPSGHKGL
jgi:hypothetical protein